MWKQNKKYLLWGISVVCAVIVYIHLVISQMIPIKYLLAFLILLIVVCCVAFGLQRRQSKQSSAVAILLEILVIAVSCYGISISQHMMRMVQKITQVVTETEAISAYVLADSDLKSIQEAKDSCFGIVNDQSEQAVRQMLDRLSEEMDTFLNIQEYGDMFLAVDALQNAEVQVVVLNDAYAGIIEEIEGYEWFAEGTRVLSSSIEEVRSEVIVTPGKQQDESDSNQFSDSQDESGSNQFPDRQEQNGTEKHEAEENGESFGAGTSSTASPTLPSMELMEIPEQVDWEALVNQRLLTAPDGTFIVYISGADTWGRASTKSRSDVNILAVVNTSTKKLLLVSTPRDYYVPLANSRGVKDKLTHAGIYGIDNSVGTLEMLYGVDIQYYVKMNFTGFVGIVDAIGGVDVYSDSDFSVGEGLTYVQGMNHMNGIQALAFARERHSFAGGDRARGTHQMEVIKAVLSQAMSPSILYNYADVMNSVSGCFTTDMPQDKIASLVRMQLNDMAGWSISMISVDGSGASKTTFSVPGKRAYVMIPDDNTVQAARDAIAAVLSGQ